MNRNVLVILIFMSGLLFSCSDNRLKVNLSGIKEKVEVVAFGKAIQELANQPESLLAIDAVREEYPEFFDLFTQHVIRIGSYDEDGFHSNLMRFVRDTMIQHVELLVQEEFENFNPFRKQFVKAFKYYKYHYPEDELPDIYTYVSGFNQSVVTYDNMIGVSLDKYLGRDCMYYQMLSTTPKYKVLNMYKERMLPDVAMAWGMSKYEEECTATNLLGHMIHKGKLMYFVDAMLPAVHDSVKIGYTGRQLKFCENNEVQMWDYLVTKKMLFSNKRMDIIRYINDAPSTSGFPLQSPGRAGVWLGWQIVRSYMKKFPEVTLKELMDNNNYQEILNRSDYFPG